MHKALIKCLRSKKSRKLIQNFNHGLKGKLLDLNDLEKEPEGVTEDKNSQMLPLDKLQYIVNKFSTKITDVELDLRMMKTGKK